MSSILCLAVILAAAGCQRDADQSPPVTEAVKVVAEPPAPADPAYASDIGKLCDSFTLSGADQLPAHARQLTIAQWLPANLQTSESRDFLVRIQPLGGEPKAAALEAEARRVGLAGCALAAEWRTPTP